MVIYKESLPTWNIKTHYAENEAQYLILRVEQQQRPKAQPQKDHYVKIRVLDETDSEICKGDI